MDAQCGLSNHLTLPDVAYSKIVNFCLYGEMDVRTNSAETTVNGRVQDRGGQFSPSGRSA
jgi:hypothetical protein